MGRMDDKVAFVTGAARGQGSGHIGNAVLFLTSDEERYITGVALPVDAGSCLK
jgi:NAD(P)-dependent dehydrogenase (short-subunit alcohol dehydrogenase family)